MDTELALADVGEFGLIERIRRIVPSSSAVVGVGDDTAVLDVGGPDYLLATADMLVEGVHFYFDLDVAEAVGRRAMAVNISDVAAMGGVPYYALTSLAAPPSTRVAAVEAVYRGLAAEAVAYHVAIVGGNTTGTRGPVCLDVMLLGRVPRDEVVLRSGARPGDVLCVTGPLGEQAALRLAAEQSGLRVSYPVPRPRTFAGRALASRHLAKAMMDISDGLGGDIHRVAEASAVGAVIRADAVPVARSAERFAATSGQTPLSLALFGGEDYELLVALAPEDLETAARALGDTPLIAIGTVTPRHEGVLLELPDGTLQPLPPGGWTHF